jgi:hypothetical protein
MPVIFRKDASKGRSPAGDIPYPLPPGVGVTAVVEGFVGPSNVPLHQHDDEEHYWFILEGSGSVMVGDEEFEVELGDLVITLSSLRLAYAIAFGPSKRLQAILHRILGSSNGQ